MQQTQLRRPLAEKFALSTERLGPLPLVNHFISRLGLIELLDHYVPTTDRRCAVPHGTALGVLLRSIVVEREPIYRQVETVHGFAPAMYGLGEEDLGHLGDDRLGRALDRLYDADRGALLTAVVLAVGKCFAVKFEELHNDSTSIRFCGQYRVQPETVRGQRPPRIVFGYSKDHRPDLKQLLFILTTAEDGGVPVQFRIADGNTNDSIIHIETWNTLKSVAGRSDFLKRYFLHTTVTAEAKRRIKAAAEAEFLTPAAWLRRVVMRALPFQPPALECRRPVEGSAELCDRRLYIRISPEDFLLLKARALARATRPATYVGVLVRSHLRSLSPVPKDELLALRRAVSELGALTRELHRIAHALGQHGRTAAPEQPDLPAVLRLCQALRCETKALIRANVNSWEIGRPQSAMDSRALRTL